MASASARERASFAWPLRIVSELKRTPRAASPTDAAIPSSILQVSAARHKFMPGEADIGVLEIATVYKIIIKAPDGWSSEDMRAALQRATDPEFVRSAYGALADGRDGRTQADARTTEIIRLDASRWTGVLDFYDAILPALGAPDWHGKNLNALVDSVVWGGINAVEPPFRIEIVNADDCAADIRSELAWAVEGIRQAKADHIVWRGVERHVEFEVLPRGAAPVSGGLE